MGIKETALALHLQYPKTYIAFSRGYSSSHLGVDMAWNSAQGGAHVPVFSPADGTVVTAVDGKGNTWGTSDHGYGNYVIVEHAPGVRTLVGHLEKWSVAVKVGQAVKRGQTLGIQGSSGYSNGYHVHYEVRLDGTKVNPVDYTFAYPTQVVNKYTQSDYGIKHYEPIQNYGHPVERNSKVDQFRIDTDTLRARTEPSLKGKVLGYVNKGIYNVGESVRADGYIWYKIEDFWCAYDKQWAEFLPKQDSKYTLTMSHLNEAQKAAMVAWCEGEKVEYKVSEE